MPFSTIKNLPSPEKQDQSTDPVSDSPLIIDDQLIDHLAVPESALRLFRERINRTHLVIKPGKSEDESFAAEVLDFVTNFIKEHGNAPTTEVVQDKFIKFQFSEPLCPIDYLIQKIRTRYKRNQLQPLIKNLSRLTVKDPDEAVAKGFSGFYSLVSETRERVNQLDHEDYLVAIDNYKERVKSGHFNGVTFGWSDIDDILGGLRKGTLNFVLARPKRFKSWHLLKSAVEAQWAGHNVSFESLELPYMEMYNRYLCLVSGVSYSRMYHGTLGLDDLNHIKDAMEDMNSKGGSLTITHASLDDRTAPVMLERAKELNADVLYIDQMSYMEMAGRERWDKNYEKVTHICHELKAASDTMPIYIAAQFNREAASLSEMADLAKIGLSDSIGQTADLLLGLYQSKEMRENKLVEFGVVDSRNTEHASFLIQVELTEGCEFAYVGRA